MAHRVLNPTPTSLPTPTPTYQQHHQQLPPRSESPTKVPIPLANYGKENTGGTTTSNPPSAPASVARYAHPHSPNPSHIALSQSPRLDASQGFQQQQGRYSGEGHQSPYTSAYVSPLLHSNSTYSPLPSPQFSHSSAFGNTKLVSKISPPLATYTRSIAPPHSQSQSQQSYHRPSPVLSAEPTMLQLLAEQPTGSSAYNNRMGERDMTMGNATGAASWRKGQGFKEWEKVRLDSPEVRRKADVAQLFFYDHYFDLLTYIHARKERLSTFKSSVSSRQLSPLDANAEWASYKGRERVLLRKRRTKLKLDQFHILTQVGQGGYGEVYLAKHKESHQVVALKKLRKRTLLKMDEIRHVLTERDILASTNSPWLVRLLYAFQDSTHVYLAMDFIAGGDFRTLLNNSGVLKEEHAKFYISEMFCAVTQLHKLGYIHRDLKPENFLIDPSGHIKLTDFGLASGALNPGKIENMKHKLDEVKDRELIYRTTVEMKSIYKSIRMADPRYADSVVGSPDYMAIETLRGSSYSFSVDYWSLGCILFEFLAGFPPFSGATSEETWSNLKNWSRVLRRPHYDREEDRMFNLTDVGWSAVTSLITTKDRRLSTFEEVKSHPFFLEVEWDRLRECKAPFIPALDSEVDSGYFDDFTSEADMAKYAEVREKQKNVDRVQEKEDKFGRGVWVGFTFKGKKNEVISEPIEGDDELITLF